MLVSRLRSNGKNRPIVQQKRDFNAVGPKSKCLHVFDILHDCVDSMSTVIRPKRIYMMMMMDANCLKVLALYIYVGPTVL